VYVPTLRCAFRTVGEHAPVLDKPVVDYLALRQAVATALIKLDEAAHRAAERFQIRPDKAWEGVMPDDLCLARERLVWALLKLSAWRRNAAPTPREWAHPVSARRENEARR